MATEVFMPALGMAQETGTLLTWHKQPGDPVAKGELLMTVATDKTDVDIEASAAGILAAVTAHEGDEVPVGQVIALLLTQEEAAAPRPTTTAVDAPTLASAPAAPPPGATPSGNLPSATPVATRLAAEKGVDLRLVSPGESGKIQKEDVLTYLAQHEPAQPGPTTGTGNNGTILASPKARRLAREQGLDLAAVTGSGPDGARLAADVLAAAAAATTTTEPGAVAELGAVAESVEAPPAGPAPNIVPMSRPWRIMAQRLQQSWTTVPHFYLEREADAGEFVRWRERAQARSTVKITVTDLLVKLVAAALRAHPRVNASWLNDEIVLNDDVNIGLAVAVEEGLLVPVVHQADSLGLSAIAARRAEVVEKAQQGKLTPADLSGGTFTISNLGMYGIDKFNAIVNPPQAAILAVGRIVDKIVPVNGQATVRTLTTLTLSCDHRVVDGARAAQFMQTLVRYLEEPLSLLD